MTENPKTALQDGSPVRTREMPPWPHFAKDEVTAATEVLESGEVNQWTGDDVTAFEDEFAEYIGADHAVAMANGTVALELAYASLGLGKGDEVVVPSRTFIATASAAHLVGATPVVADVDPQSGNVTPETIRNQITPDTAAVAVVHIEGWPADMPAIRELADDQGLALVEDCAQAHGAQIDGREVGTFSDVAAFSFCQDKIMTTAGEGGMVVTDDEDLYRDIWEMKDHGKDYDVIFNEPMPEEYGLPHARFGTNLRLSTVQAAVGRRQLSKLGDWLEARQRNAEILIDAFQNVPGLRAPSPPDTDEHAFYKYSVYVEPDELTDGWDRLRVMKAIEAEGIPCSVGECSEIYREPAFERAGLAPDERLANAQRLQETSLQFLVHPTLDPSDMADVVQAVDKVMQVATNRGND